MTSSLENKWNNFSDIDIELFTLINKIAGDNNCSYFLVGAKARDILLDYFDKKVELRKTLDTDIALCCRNWQVFYKIKNAFVNGGDFTADGKIEHRIKSTKYGWLDIEKCLGHKMPKIMATYNRNEMLPQRQDALESWANCISNLLQDKVVFLNSQKAM